MMAATLAPGGTSLSVTGGDLTAGAIDLLVNNRNGGSIDQGASISFNIGGALNVTNDASFVITNRNDGLGGGTMGSDVILTLDAASISAGGFMDAAISANAGGTIPSATLFVSAPGDLLASGGYFSEIQSTGFNVPGGPFIQGGMITGDASLVLTFGSVTSGDVFDIEIDNYGQGNIGGNALLGVGISGDLNTASDIFTDIINTAVQGDVTIAPGGSIGGSATVAVVVGGDIISSGVGEFAVLNNDRNFLSEAGTILGDALVTVEATNITTGGFFQPVVNNTNGAINGNASVLVAVTGNVNVGAETFFNIFNTGGTIGGQAFSSLAANNFTSGSTFNFQILNDNGVIGGDASLTADLGGNLTSHGVAVIQISNSAGSIGGNAFIDVNTFNLGANSLTDQINNTGGTIGGSATISSSVPGAFSVAGDATFDILGSSAASGGAAINFNGGSYTAGGTFLSTIDGDGGITFSNASVNADVLKAGVFGTNGTLTVGGANLSANTELKLYAPGSNGRVNFVGNVTLDSGSSVIIAANAVTINNGVVVTITGDDGVNASVYTNVPNYTGSGGNGSTTGVFAENGAQTLPLNQAPPFNDAAKGPAHGSTTSGGGAATILPRPRRLIATARVADSNELLDLADQAVIGSSKTSHNRSITPTGRKTLAPGSALPGKGLWPATPKVIPASLPINRRESRTPLVLP